ncbi:hypothetical protein ALC56_08661 [Trachymyrmex septentrionalis]|uniref:Uncharacterized protein n=1 Tax=Trachymyrmex septentrionalis TaxID=34720 RepID=A0A195F8C4_9HYME|nr:hypothetical protein ALC56_08661 [Trachymyrmex septentrionalis]
MPPPRRRRKRTPASEGSLIPTDSFVGARPPPPPTPHRRRRRRRRRRIYPSNADLHGEKSLPDTRNPFFSSPTVSTEESRFVVNPLTLDSHPLYTRLLPISPPRVILSLIRRCISLLRTAATGLLQATSLESPQPFSSVHPILLAARCSADLYDSTKLSILSGATFTTPPPPSHFFPLFADRYIACAHRSSTTIRPVLVTRRCDAPTRSLSPRFFPG